jgi:thioredoxin
MALPDTRLTRTTQAPSFEDTKMAKAKKKSKKKRYSGPKSSMLKKSKASGSKGNPIAVRSQVEFERYLDEGKPVIVDFWAEWCGPCKAFAPTFEKVGKEMEGKAYFLKVDTEKATELANAFRIRSIPTVIAMVGDEVVDTSLGMMSEPALRKMTQRAIDKAEGVSVGDKMKRFFGLGGNKPSAESEAEPKASAE